MFRECFKIFLSQEEGFFWVIEEFTVALPFSKPSAVNQDLSTWRNLPPRVYHYEGMGIQIVNHWHWYKGKGLYLTSAILLKLPIYLFSPHRKWKQTHSSLALIEKDKSMSFTNHLSKAVHMGSYHGVADML